MAEVFVENGWFLLNKWRPNQWKPTPFFNWWIDPNQSNGAILPILEMFNHEEKGGRSLKAASIQPFLWMQIFHVFGLWRGWLEASANFHDGSNNPLGRFTFRPSLVWIDSVLSKWEPFRVLLVLKLCPHLYSALHCIRYRTLWFCHTFHRTLRPDSCSA